MPLALLFAVSLPGRVTALTIVNGFARMMRDTGPGVAVHVAARVLGEAAPSEVLASSTVKDLVIGSGRRFTDGGTRELKGVGEWRFHALER